MEKNYSDSARLGKIDIRDDEEQQVKLNEILELLVAAGYFRARIKGLSPFDKIVGGMTWCIRSCNFDIDVDLFFNENFSIGQKIALTERIVSVLPVMKCSHLVEPHQIQGLDAIHLFPVIKWLVKEALEARVERQDETRMYAMEEFVRTYGPVMQPYRQVYNSDATNRIMKVLNKRYGPERRRHKKVGVNCDTLQNEVLMTLMEYNADEATCEKETLGALEDLSVTERKYRGVPLENFTKESVSQIDSAIQHYEHLKQAMPSATSMTQITTNLRLDMKNLESVLQDLEEDKDGFERRCREVRKEVEVVGKRRKGLEVEVEKRKKEYDGVEDSTLQSLNSLLSALEQSKRDLSSFKQDCKTKANQMEQKIDDLQSQLLQKEEVSLKTGVWVDGDDELLEDEDHLQQLQTQLHTKARQVQETERRLDDVPGYAEMSQYEKRFAEIYNQVSREQHELHQFCNLFNTLQDAKSYLQKEVNLLNSVVDNLAVDSSSNNTNFDSYNQQLEAALHALEINQNKLHQKQQTLKSERTQVCMSLDSLQEQQRVYAALVQKMATEIQLNERLQQKVMQ